MDTGNAKEGSYEGLSLAGRQYLWGQFFGYPKCCTAAFVKALEKDDGSGADIHQPEQYQAGRDTGFIPCPYCAARVLAGQVALPSLVLDRQAPWPFYPLWPSMWDDEKEEWDEETARRNRLARHWIDMQLVLVGAEEIERRAA